MTAVTGFGCGAVYTVVQTQQPLVSSQVTFVLGSRSRPAIRSTAVGFPVRDALGQGADAGLSGDEQHGNRRAHDNLGRLRRDETDYLSGAGGKLPYRVGLAVIKRDGERESTQ